MPHGMTTTSEPMVPPRVVLFDWDNTLVDSWGCIQAATNATLRAMGHETWTLEEMKDRVALSLRDSFPRLFGDRWTEARDIFYAEFAAIHLDYLRPLPGVEAMLDSLAEMGLRLGVVSNKNGAFLREEIGHLGWGGRFDKAVGATDAPADKPDPAAVALALTPMACAPGPAVWLAGDAEVDMQGAIASGCVPVLLRKDPPRDGEFDRFPPKLRFSSCHDFVQEIRELVIPMT